jgi:hypothetical protein
MKKTLTLALLLALSASAWAEGEPKPPAKEPVLFTLATSEKTTLPLAMLMNSWAMHSKRGLVIDPLLVSHNLAIRQKSKDWTRSDVYWALDQIDAVLVETERTISVHARRNVATRQLPTPVFVRGNQALPSMNRPVMWIYHVRNGAASSIFANLRGMMSRDPTRYANILYVQGPELLIVRDLSRTLRLYQRTALELDGKGTSAKGTPRATGEMSLDVYEVDAAAWAPLRRKGAAAVQTALDAAVAAKTAIHLERARLDASQGFSLHKTTRGKAGSLHLSVALEKGKLRLEVQRLSEGAEQSRNIEVAAPNGASDTVLSASMTESKKKTQVVFVLRQIK